MIIILESVADEMACPLVALNSADTVLKKEDDGKLIVLKKRWTNLEAGQQKVLENLSQLFE